MGITIIGLRSMFRGVVKTGRLLVNRGPLINYRPFSTKDPNDWWKTYTKSCLEITDKQVLAKRIDESIELLKTLENKLKKEGSAIEASIGFNFGFVSVTLTMKK